MHALLSLPLPSRPQIGIYVSGLVYLRDIHKTRFFQLFPLQVQPLPLQQQKLYLNEASIDNYF